MDLTWTSFPSLAPRAESGLLSSVEYIYVNGSSQLSGLRAVVPLDPPVGRGLNLPGHVQRQEKKDEKIDPAGHEVKERGG